MKYLYFPDSHWYAGEAPDDVLIPHCLTVAPPANDDPNSVVVADLANSAWVVRLMNDAELASIKAAQIAMLLGGYANAIQQPVSYTNTSGVTKAYQADPQSVANLQAMLLAFQSSGGTPAGFYWVAADNTQVPFSYADMQGLALAFGTQGAVAFQHLQTQKAAVNAAATYTAIKAVSW